METAATHSAQSTDAALTLLREHGEATNNYLRGLRARYTEAPDKLLDAIDYSLLAGGKRLRPALVLECARAVSKASGGAASATGEPNASALAAAAAIELIHTFSLVHDDLPAMDDDDLRRGVPTNHKVYGEAMAILAGDAMVTMAFEVLATGARVDLVPALVRELAAASGPQGMIGGQVLDMDGEARSLPLAELQRLHRLKTGALLTCACRLGAIASEGLAAGQQGDGRVRGQSSTRAEAALLRGMTEFGQHLGLAFQIVDDVLDVTSTPQQLGKATNKDAGRGKNTYPSLLGLEGSRAEAARQLSAAVDALRPMGSAADGLRALASFVVERNM